jgi:hypothetical protein
MMMGIKFSTRISVAIIFFLSVNFINPLTGLGQEENWETKTIETGDFTGLFLEGAFGVQLIQGTTPSLEVRTSDPKAFEYLEVTNERGLLHLHVDRKPFDFSRIKLYVTFESLERLRIFGGIHLDTRGYLDLEHIEMLVEGGAKVNVQLKARGVELENRGGVLCELGGVSESLDIRLAGAGHIDAGELRARDVNFKIEGVGTGVVHATKTLNAQISGAGKIKYLGNPKVTQNIEGLGSVERDNRTRE